MCTYVFQNQRFYVGQGWRPATPGKVMFRSDPGEWTTTAEMAIGDPPQIGVNGWQVVLRKQTDSEGWRYALNFEEIGEALESSASFKRPTDIVRQRMWTNDPQPRIRCFLQHERFFVGLGWRASEPNNLFRYDPMPWTTVTGETVVPPEGGPNDLQVVLRKRTDLDGWRYALNFDELREGQDNYSGFRRPRDVVRQRMWTNDPPPITCYLQHERLFVAKGWIGTAPNNLFRYDPMEWTTACGDTAHPPDMGDEDLLIVRGDGTDMQGWEYGLNFEDIDQHRDHGRGLRRATDVVRRRRWIRRDALSELQRSEKRSIIARTRLEMEADISENNDRQWAALQTIINVIMKALQTRSMFRKMSLMSPDSWVRLSWKHQDQFASLVAGLTNVDRALLERDDNVDRRVRGLLFALPYAKAVYGRAMLKGYMNSLADMARNQITGKNTVDPKTDITAMCDMLGREEADLLHANFHVSPMRPAHAVLLDREAKAVVLTIRGTVSPEDALTDVMANAVSDNESSQERKIDADGLSFHEGFVHAAKWIYEEVRPSLEKAFQTHPNYRLLLVGHSLGAGVAAILALVYDLQACLQVQDGQGKCKSELADDLPQCVLTSFFSDEIPLLNFSSVECYAFACPGCASLVVSTSQRAQRVVTTLLCGLDMIVRTSIHSVDSLCHDVAMESSATKCIDAIGSIIGGKVEEYATKRKVRTNDQMLEEPQFPIGYCLFVGSTDGAEATLQIAQPKDFDEILLHSKMLSDHLLARYEELLLASCNQLGIGLS
eukprot:TRINITY_DN61386_c0_g1_i1.p1 TRINITY_DN61386_c0_g1~~TRINITY_DN61386_c0_g1_i1.p1  ORF type:complete len:774 (-),score=76.21 TRINITY_DN61386_c0_g1_i1:119-2440(-)